MSPEQVDAFLGDLREAFTALEEFRMPTIAAIDGPALGGGLELALCVDLRVASTDVTKIGLPETKLGVIPGAGGTQRAARLLGLAKAKDLIFTGKMMNANEAHAFGGYHHVHNLRVRLTSLCVGLIDYVAEPSSTAFDRALELANQISTGGACEIAHHFIARLKVRRIGELAPLALQAAKMAVSRAGDLSLERGLDFERACYGTLLRSKDRVEALEAFKEKRKPMFIGE